MSDRQAGPRELVIASAIIGAILLAFWGGYELGKAIGREQAVSGVPVQSAGA